MRPTPKPKHLGPQYAEQFKDHSVASAYLHRPPYPAELFDVLESLIQGRPRVILDMGSGTGAIAIPMAGRVDRVDAVDPSEAMLKMAQTRPGWDQENIRWVCTSAEDFDYQGRYGLIVAGASLHWMDLVCRASENAAVVARKRPVGNRGRPTKGRCEPLAGQFEGDNTAIFDKSGLRAVRPD